MTNVVRRFYICTLCCILFWHYSCVLAGVVLDPHLYVWSNNVGYINFRKVTVSDNSLAGYAWSQNKGWINFSPKLGGVSNDGQGNLSGFAWGDQLGWIDFSNVQINGDGEFLGTASGSSVGIITFNCHFCDIKTDWRPPKVSSVIPVGRGAGAGGIFSRASGIVSIHGEAPARSTLAPTALLSPGFNRVFPVSSTVRNIGGTSPAPKPVSTSAENAPLFDVVSEPIYPKAQNNILAMVYLTLSEIVLILFIILIVKHISNFFIRRATENILKNKNDK